MGAFSSGECKKWMYLLKKDTKNKCTVYYTIECWKFVNHHEEKVKWTYVFWESVKMMYLPRMDAKTDVF